MFLTDLSIKRPVVASVMSLVLVIFGLVVIFACGMFVDLRIEFPWLLLLLQGLELLLAAIAILEALLSRSFKMYER